MSLVILAAAFLFLRNLFAARELGPGFDLMHTLRAEVNLPSDRYTTPARIRDYADRVLPQLQALPGITSAAAARIVPFTDSTRYGATITFPDTGDKVDANFSWNAVSPDFFHAMEIPVLEGRAFTAADRTSSLVVIVNRTFANRFLGGRAAVGQSFLWGRDAKELLHDRRRRPRHQDDDRGRGSGAAALSAAGADHQRSTPCPVRAPIGDRASAARRRRAPGVASG